MKKTPTIALCIPAYNAAKFLPRLLESALQQTIPFDEIWVYDDCSTDDTGKVAVEYGAKVVRGETNQGCSHGKNTLAEMTSCDWLHFHDADDAMYPNFVERAHVWMKAGNIDVVLFGYEYIDYATGQQLAVRYYDDLEVRRDAISYAIREQIQSIVGIYRRDTFLKAGGYDLDPLVLYNEDVAMHCQLARQNLRFAAEPTLAIINYRYSESMSVSNQVKCFQAQFHVMRKAAEALQGRYSTEICQRLWQIAAASAAHLDWKNSDACVSLALALGNRVPVQASSLFKVLCRCNPFMAIRIRESLIRRLKPNLRDF